MRLLKVAFIVANIIKDNGNDKLFWKLFQNDNTICWRLFPFDQPWNNVLIQWKQRWARPGTSYGGTRPQKVDASPLISGTLGVALKLNHENIL